MEFKPNHEEYRSALNHVIARLDLVLGAMEPLTSNGDGVWFKHGIMKSKSIVEDILNEMQEKTPVNIQVESVYPVQGGELVTTGAGYSIRTGGKS